MTDEGNTSHDPAAAILALLAARALGATICPSEAARRVAADGDWRAAMPTVHAAVDRLLAHGAIQLRWKGAALAVRLGPYRIAQGIAGEWTRC